MIENFKLISAFPGIQKIENFSFAHNTTLGIGGNSPLAIFPKTELELIKVIEYLKTANIRYEMFGMGANTLVSDNGFGGIVICTKNLKKICMMPDNRVYAECGVSAEKFVKFCEENSLTNAEFLAGIPATVGGLAYMNAGADNTYVESIIEKVKVLRDGKIFDISVHDCKYSYKRSLFQENDDCIIGCIFRLRIGNITEIAAKIRKRKFARSKLPKGKSLGCVFKNPPDISAGELIDQSGWKGYRIGGASVSDNHANFIINKGGATSRDFISLVELIESDVLKKTGIKLKREFCYIGD